MDSKLPLADILLVEDDPEVRGVFREFLSAEGYRVRVAADGREALESVPAPDVILTDLNMPVMDGWELLRVLREDPVLTRIPVAIMTAEENFPPGYLVLKKPFRMDDLLRFLESSCSAVSGEHAIESSSAANLTDAED